MKTNPVVSIISVVYNDINIENTIKSIIPYLNNDIEYIIIDGNSNDGTKEIITQYIDALDYFLSEPDNGIYDAMNKAVKYSHGKYILHLNSGDTLMNLPIDLIKYQDADILSFPVSINDGEMVYEPLFDNRTKYRTSLHHQGTLYKREFVDYNTQFKIFADFDLNQRLYKRGVRATIYNDPIVSNHLENGVSARTPKRRIEHSLIIKKNFGLKYYWIYYFYLIYKYLKNKRY